MRTLFLTLSIRFFLLDFSERPWKYLWINSRTVYIFSIYSKHLSQDYGKGVLISSQAGLVLYVHSSDLTEGDVYGMNG